MRLMFGGNTLFGLGVTFPSSLDIFHEFGSATFPELPSWRCLRGYILSVSIRGHGVTSLAGLLVHLPGLGPFSQWIWIWPVLSNHLSSQWAPSPWPVEFNQKTTPLQMTMDYNIHMDHNIWGFYKILEYPP